MNRVFVLDKNKVPLMPCHPARAKELLDKGKAAVYRMAPFTIILKEREGGDLQNVEVKVDPGSKTTGIALVSENKRGKRVVWAGHIQHRGNSIKKGLEQRRANRRGRRSRNLRYRAPRFNNRAKAEGWLPPSLMSRVNNVIHWVTRLIKLSPILDVAYESVRFDMQLMQNPNIEGIEYQQGTLFGVEVREYLLARYKNTCAYCKGHTKDPVLQREHIHPKSLGGSNKISNQAIACKTCNKDKANFSPDAWIKKLEKSKSVLNKKRLINFTKIASGVKPSLSHAAAMNATRNKLGEELRQIGLPVSSWSGGRTKFNRTQQGYKKDHFCDAACIGETGGDVFIPKSMKPLIITAIGRGNRQMCQVDKYGFPRSAPKSLKQYQGFKSGDLVRLDQPRGKYKGIHVGKCSIRKTGIFGISTVINRAKKTIDSKYINFTQLQKTDGYSYAT
jgi:5-methylcytosine-specific restriction endonuclease McrA